MSNYFAFIDESGNSAQERYFSLGMLLIDDEIGDFYDSMKPFYAKAYDLARNNKLIRIDQLEKEGEYSQISEIAKSGKRFELKFKYINSTNNLVYKALIENYSLFSNVRFCALIVDRQKTNSNGKKWQVVLNPWEVYIQQAAMLIANNVKNITPCQLCVIADDLTRPSNIQKSFEKSLADAISFRLKKQNDSSSIFGVSRLESHSSLLLQIVDILLGCVMFYYKNQANLISSKLAEKQGIVAKTLCEKLKSTNLAQNKTYHQPNYFSVWEFNER